MPAASVDHRPGRRRAGVVLLLVAFALCAGAGLVALRAVGPAVDAAFLSDPCAVPCSTSVTLGEGTYLVFAKIDPLTGRTGVFRPSDMALATDGGVSLQVAATRADETIDRNGSVYRGVLRFTVAEPGRYRVALTAPAGARIVIAPSLMQTFVRVLPAVGLVVAALPVGVIGLILVLLGGRRSNRALGWAGTSRPRP